MSYIHLYKQMLTKGFIDSHTYNNGIITRPFRTALLTAYRGERTSGKVTKEGNIDNGGMAYLGRGIYSTTSKKNASKYGDSVRKVSSNELPALPFRFKTYHDYEYFHSRIINIYGWNWFNDVGGLRGILIKCGFDGCTIGTVQNMDIVKYT